ncbi:protein lin-54 homolog isoform X2 [Micropterus salmoides]|uniref:protein lin-54 homolog isoform X2 n=1 Tax=Micropterus salmoides TaxID=27706 RepID=UPI0018ED5EA3|nr:protein lin-54 homolog isoform X2 [Micropterus salmoides]
MNTYLTELNTAQSRQEYIDADDCSSKEDNNVNPGPAGTPLWTGPPSDVSLPGVAPHHHQYIIQPGMVDPLSLRFPYPCQSTHCQLNYPDYLLEPQSSQYHLLTDPVPGPPDSSLHSSGSAHWFTNEPILCSMMPGDLHAPVSSICVPQAVDHQQFQEGLTEFTSHIPQHVMCNVSGGGQVVLVNPCEPGPVFLTLKSAPTHTDDGPTAGEDVSVLGTPSQLPQYHQTTCPQYESRDQTANTQLQALLARTVGTCESKSRKPCHCTRSQCLKLYCECFANGVMCSNCDCSNCHNNAEHEMKRHKAIKANIMCTSSCKCVGCRNYDDGSETGLKEKTVNVKDKWPVSVITPAVVEAVCGCLLAQAEGAEREAQSRAQAEHMVLDEFGHCLTQIVMAMFKYNTY